MTNKETKGVILLHPTQLGRVRLTSSANILIAAHYAAKVNIYNAPHKRASERESLFYESYSAHTYITQGHRGTVLLVERNEEKRKRRRREREREGVK